MRIADFRQRAELERARDRLAALDEVKARFSANVHHELRTPLTLILAPLDALRSGEFGEVPEVVGRTLRTMHINGQRLLKMINNLLDLAKVESQSFDVHRRPMDLVQLLQDVVDGAEGLARRKNLELVLEAPSGDPIPRLNADPDALEKVVMNLVGNALKFTGEGGRITVSVQAGARVDGYDGVEVAVTDTGVGLPPDELERVFDRFSQVDSSATRKHEGTGIGLSLALELVELHGGRIWAESEGEGCGTSMRFLVPIGEVDDDAPADEMLCDDEGHEAKLATSVQAVEADLGLPAEPGDRARFVEMERSVRSWGGELELDAEGGSVASRVPDDAPEVLVVEDNPDMRELLVFLVGNEFRVRSAKNGIEALERVAEALPDLVLTDVMMPEMSGTELCHALKSGAATQNLPVVLVTSKAENEMKVKGLELGADDYVTKPFHPKELLARVRTLVTQSALRRELATRNTELETAMADLEYAQVKLVQSERLAAVGELAAGIAHEVNNPVNFALNAVRAMKASVLELRELGESVAALEWEDEALLGTQLEKLRALADDLGVAELTDALGELSEIVSEGLKRTHSLVADLRDFAAPGRGDRGAVDVAKGLRSTTQLLKHLLRDANASLTLKLPEGLPHVDGDAGALNQVFLNLIKNAAEALPDEGGSIVVEASIDSGRLRVAIRDNGSGIPEDARVRLFEPFFTTKPESQGTGLGLSICKQITEAHGGELEVESEVGQGTCMTMVLPLLESSVHADVDREYAAGDA
jgi:signal transduction histidine kinase